MFSVSLSRQIPDWILKPNDTVVLALSRCNLSSKHYLPTDHFLPCCHGEISRLVRSKATFVIAYPAFSIQNSFKKERTKNTQLKVNIHRSWEVCFWNRLLKFESEKCFLTLSSLSLSFPSIIPFSSLSPFKQSTELHLYLSDGRVSSTELPPVQTHENFYGVSMSHAYVR